MQEFQSYWASRRAVFLNIRIHFPEKRLKMKWGREGLNPSNSSPPLGTPTHNNNRSMTATEKFADT